MKPIAEPTPLEVRFAITGDDAHDAMQAMASMVLAFGAAAGDEKATMLVVGMIGAATDILRHSVGNEPVAGLLDSISVAVREADLADRAQTKH